MAGSIGGATTAAGTMGIHRGRMQPAATRGSSGGGGTQRRMLGGGRKVQRRRLPGVSSLPNTKHRCFDSPVTSSSHSGQLAFGASVSYRTSGMDQQDRPYPLRNALTTRFFISSFLDVPVLLLHPSPISRLILACLLLQRDRV